MEDKQFIPVVPQQPVQQPEESISVAKVSAEQSAHAAASILGSQALQTGADQHKSKFTGRVESAKKFRRFTGFASLAGIGLTTVLYVAGLTSPDAEFVGLMQKVVGLIGIVSAVIIGLWLSQATRVSINSYQEGLAEPDSNNAKRRAWFSRLKISGLVLYAIAIPLLISSVFGQILFGRSSSSESSDLVSIVGGLLGLGATVASLVASIVFIIATIKLSRSRVKTLTQTANTNTVHWVLRLVLCLVAFTAVSGPALLIVGIMILQLYLHWCTLTNSKCY